MTLPLLILAGAETDLAQAKEWYRQHSPSLEQEFASCVQETMERIRSHPAAYEADGPFRRAFLHRFPYRVIYRPTATCLVVVGILHNSRDPRTWQERSH